MTFTAIAAIARPFPARLAAHAGNQAHDGENRPDKRGEKRHVVDDRHQRCHECDDSEHQADDGKPRSRLFRLFNFHVFPPIAAVFPSNHFGDAIISTPARHFISCELRGEVSLYTQTSYHETSQHFCAPHARSLERRLFL